MPVRLLAGLILALLLAACGGTGGPPGEVLPAKPLGTGAMLAGTVSYQEAASLPPGSILTVDLQDVSRPDAPAVTIGRSRDRVVVSQSNLSYRLSYDPALVRADGRYVLKARIEADRRILFANREPVPVLTGSDRQDHDGRANITVQMVPPPVPK